MCVCVKTFGNFANIFCGSPGIVGHMEIMNEIIYEYHHHSCINYVLRTLRVLCIYVTRCATVEMLNITWPFYRVEPFTHGDGVRVRFTGNNVICGTVQQYENNAVPRKSFIVSEPQREYCITRTLAGPFNVYRQNFTPRIRLPSEFRARPTDSGVLKNL